MKLGLIIIAITIELILNKSRPMEDKMCISENVWQNLENSTKLIGDPTKCTRISIDCCFITLKYAYLEHIIYSEYCASLTGDLNDFKKFLINTYTDETLFYSTSSYYNFEIFLNIGRQFEGKYYENMKCTEPAVSDKEFSNFLESNCGYFDPQSGNCLEQKDTEYFNEFVAAFYQNFTANYCNKKDSDGKCVLYTGAQQNNAMVRPLLLDLVGYLHIDDPNYDSNDGNVDVPVNNTMKWPNTTECSPRQPVEVKIICPEGYVEGERVNISLYLIILFILSILIY